MLDELVNAGHLRRVSAAALQPEEAYPRGMLANPAFWAGGVLSALIWVGLIAAARALF